MAMVIWPPPTAPFSAVPWMEALFGVDGAAQNLQNVPWRWNVRRAWTKPVALLGAAAALFAATDAHAARTLAEYRYFRTLSIDLQGRMPTRVEVAAFEKDGFSVDEWIDARLKEPAYAERVRRIYMDLMRMEIGTNFQFVQNPTVLRRVKVKDPNGVDTYVYYRSGQRRMRPETDGIFCMTVAETGLTVPASQTEIGTAIPINATVWNQYTKTVAAPWWLGTGSGFTLSDTMGKNPDLSAATNVRVCNEETLAPPTAPVTISPFTAVCDPKAPPFGRVACPPKDNFLQGKYKAAFTKDPNTPKIMVSCDSNTGFGSSAECGCGANLERCMPGAGAGFDNAAFKFPSRVPIGWDAPFDAVDQTQAGWARMFWGQEFVRFFDDIVLNDVDFRQVLKGKQTFVNGPLTQFYRDVAPGQCCGNGVFYGYTEPDPLVDPAKLPANTPRDVDTWIKVADRGPHASGFLTMPVFLTKYGSRRARAHVLWNAFACKDFIAGNLALKPSTEPDLTKRDGCNTCHATLEPISAYFARVQESSWVYLPADKFPARATKAWFDSNPANPYTADLKGQSCIRNFKDPLADGGAPPVSPGGCSSYYDPAFTFPQTDPKGVVTGGYALLRGAYGSEANADLGPAGFADYLTSTSQFESCVAENVTAGFLGRNLTSEDETLKSTLADVLAKNNFQMRALVRALVKSDAYKAANNLSSTKWREGGGL